MILTCPECQTKYVVKDGAIPPGGRQVRCASCKHSWHQDADEVAMVHDGGPIAAGGPPQPMAAEDHEAVTAEMPPQAVEEAMIADYIEPEVGGAETVDSDAPSMPADEPLSEVAATVDPDAGGGAGWPDEPFDREEWAEPPRRRFPALLAVILLIILAGFAFWFLAPPEWRAKVGLAAGDPSPLKIMVTTRDRQKLASGNELVSISGRVINPTDRDQAVPAIRAELRNHGTKQLVYSWTIAPPARSLPPGGSASFNSAEFDVPKGGDDISLILGGAAG